jgi:hypothetical protein
MNWCSCKRGLEVGLAKTVGGLVCSSAQLPFATILLPLFAMIKSPLPLLVALVALTLSSTVFAALVTPAALDRKRFTNTVTINVTGTSALLDGVPFPLATNTAVTSIGYHELTVTDGAVTTYRFLVKSSERFSTEDGIPVMRPYHFVNDAPSAFANGVLTVMLPSSYPKGLVLPIVARLTKGAAFGATAGDPLFLNGLVTAPQASSSAVQLRRGWGSSILPARTASGTLTYDAQLGPLATTKNVLIEPSTTYTTKGGTLASAETWAVNSRIYLSSKLIVAAGGNLTIGAGTVVKCAQGIEVEVAPGGSITMNGTAADPIVWVPETATQLWGGFWLQAKTATQVAQVTASNTIFCRWGNNQTWLSTAPHVITAHRDQEPLFASQSGAILTLTDCAMVGPTGLSETRGSALASSSATLNLTRTLMQRAITGGEQVGGGVTLNQCAILEMTDPGVSVDTDAFVDADNDGIYLVPGSGITYNITKTLIGWTKDDGIDSGGDGAGTTRTTNCWFENCVHEAFSNSGVGRVPETHYGVHFNCGQGMECGYGGPLSLVDHAAIIGCMVGARYGDNYGNDSGTNGTGTSQYSGSIGVNDSFLLYNYFHDSWARDLSTWNDGNAKMSLTNSKLSKAADIAAQNGVEDTGNATWSPATDGPALAAYMPVPNSNVGVDLLATARQDSLTNYPATLNVRLSTFSSKAVTVGWKVVSKTALDATASITLGSGTLSYASGETLKSFSPTAVPNGTNFVQIELTNPTNAELTGLPLTYYATTGAPADQPLVIRGNTGWRYLNAVPTDGAGHTPLWPALDAGSRTWTSPDFVESASWSSGTAPLGWGTVDGITNATVFPTTFRPVTCYFRKTFTIANPAQVKSLLLESLADDGASVYINGIRVSPITWGLDPGTSVGGTLYYDQLSSRYKDATSIPEGTYDTLTLSGATLPTLLAAPAVNVLAIEVHQQGLTSGDSAMDAKLTATFNPPNGTTAGISHSGSEPYFYWLDSALILEMSSDLNQWSSHPELTSPVPIKTNANRMFYRAK